MKEDANFHMSFVQEVEKHECLYDYNCANYYNRVVQDNTWQDVAKQMKFGTAEECKVRWKNLRGSLTRYLKAQANLQNGTWMKPVKPYYLFEAMQFLVPFTCRMNKQKDVIDDSADFNVTEDDSNYSEYVTDPIFIENDESGSSYNEITTIVKSEDANELHSYQITKQDRKSEGVSKKRKYIDDSGNNSNPALNQASVYPDLDFFRSLLPDMNNFNEHQKMTFKQNVIQLVSKVWNENNSNGIPDNLLCNNGRSETANNYQSGNVPLVGRENSSMVNDGIKNGASSDECNFRKKSINEFFSSMASTVKTFSAYRQNVAKAKIFSIISDLDMEQITQANSTTEKPKIASSCTDQEAT